MYVYAALGEKDEAFRWLDRAYDERSPWLTGIKVQPHFDPLRGDPRFEAMLARMDLRE